MRASAVAVLAAGTALLLNFRQASADTHYVWQQSPLPMPPYTSWATAAANIQDAVDESSEGDTVLVSGGVYATGGRVGYGMSTNRVVVNRAIMLKSLMGPEVTIIEGHQLPGTTNGDGAISCVYLTGGAVLSGFTLTKGATRGPNGDRKNEHNGGGICGRPRIGYSLPIVTNCLILSNTAFFSGGGAYDATLLNCEVRSNSAVDGGGAYATGQEMRNCLIIGNSAKRFGGGVERGYLQGCTIVGNSAAVSGGGFCGFSDGVLNNCIVQYNDAPTHPNIAYGSVTYSSTFPLSTNGLGNITNAPLFVDTNGWADLRLQSNSPCINAGNNAFVTTANDLDDNPRIIGGTVDMGAYEQQAPALLPYYNWLQGYGLPTDGSFDDIDGDKDNATTWQEWKAWTIPTNQLSVLKMLKANPQAGGTAIRWQSVAGHRYTLERAVGSADPFSVLESNIVGQAGLTDFVDSSTTNGHAFYYRVGVAQ